MIKKTVGVFVGSVWDPSPCSCEISKGENKISFTHMDLSDLEHLLKEMKKAATRKLPDKYKEEV